MGCHKVSIISGVVVLMTCRFSKVPHNYWKDKTNQLKALRELEGKLKISQPEDWYRIKNSNVIEQGGKALLYQYNGSLSRMLSTLYPAVQWEVTKYVAM